MDLLGLLRRNMVTEPNEYTQSGGRPGGFGGRDVDHAVLDHRVWVYEKIVIETNEGDGG